MAAAAPAADAYFPTGAGVHAVEPGGEKKPAAQLVQVVADVAPAAALNLPAGQPAQETDVCPGAGLYVPARQAVQLESEVPPGKSSAVPAGQGTQREAPGAGA